MDFFKNLPNFITLARLCLVPVSVVLITSSQWGSAFLVFVVAGLSDALDGWLAKTFHLTTELGAYLDPIADKALLVTIFITLTIMHVVPVPLTVLVVSRDFMIVGAVLMGQIMGKGLEIRPLFISKLNTTAQLAFVGLILLLRALGRATDGVDIEIAMIVVALLTLMSAGAYLRQWLRHMNA
ncbi:MAG: CDP-alcohol phosphatidyltransferase family protein [Hyphomicrobiales bacterium]|nr:CDP-alcohol phosphatidyltransferase family protein [Hyphomicrobiales bacterium]MDE2114035.1 CDP-alcohol phosphatidyltransferase family protein [Hyphomicrobiales bacterium]